MKRSKNYKNKVELKTAKSYSKSDALKLVKDLSFTKFDGSVETHLNLNISEKDKSQPLRVTIEFKHPFGEEKKILAFTDPESVKEALDAGAKYAGLEEYIKKIQGGWLDFDIVIAKPTVIPKVAVLGRVLGTRGLMPNLKNGTVTKDLVSTIKGYKSGRTNIKSDEYGIIHTIIGKVNTDSDKLADNFDTMLKGVMTSLNKTDTTFIKSIYIAPSMGPSIKIDTEGLI